MKDLHSFENNNDFMFDFYNTHGRLSRQNNFAHTLKQEFTKNITEIQNFLDRIKYEDNKDIEIDTLINSRSLLKTINQDQIFSNQKGKFTHKTTKSKRKFIKFNHKKEPNFKEYNYNFDQKAQHYPQLLYIVSNIEISIVGGSSKKNDTFETPIGDEEYIKNVRSLDSSYFRHCNFPIVFPKECKIDEEIKSDDEINSEINKFDFNIDKIINYNKYSLFNCISTTNFTLNHNSETIKQYTYKNNILDNLEKIVISKYQIKDDIPLDPKFYDVLCINCYECVKFNDIDQHSTFCVIKLEIGILNIYLYYDPHKHSVCVNSKIFKLYQGLKNMENHIGSELKSIYYSFLTSASEIYYNNEDFEILNTSVLCLTNNIDILNRKSYLSNKFSFLLPLILYSKRLVYLIYEKLSLIEKGVLLTSNKNLEPLDKEEDLTERSSHNKFISNKLLPTTLQKIKREAKLLVENTSAKLNKLNDINSNLYSKKENYTNDHTSSNSVFTNENCNDIIKGNFNDFKKADDLKKYFFSIVLYLKLKYSDQIKEQTPIQDLYQKAKDYKIDIVDWNSFIRKELKIK